MDTEFKSSHDDTKSMSSVGKKYEGLFSDIDISHIQLPAFLKFNNKLKVKGGHDLYVYPEGALIPLCFKGQFNQTSNNVMVVFMAEDPSVSKTVVPGFNHDMILELAWNPSRIYSIRKQNDSFYIYESYKDKIFFGAYLYANKKAKTMFPLLIVDGTIQNKAGKINIGAFFYMSQDYKTFTNRYPINVTVDDFNKMMRKKPLMFADAAQTIPLLSDITKGVQASCKPLFK